MESVCPDPRVNDAIRDSRPNARAERAPAVSDLTEVELFSALSRKTREGELSLNDATRIAAHFAAHLEGNLYTRLPLQRGHYRMARDWIRRFATPLRTLDALHLALAASATARLVTNDRGFARSAEQLGVEALHLT